MSTLREAWVRLLSLFRKPELDRDFDEELASHIELAVDDNLRRGMTPAEARRQALIQLGGIEPAKEAHRERRGLPWLDGILQDLRYAFRSMARAPGFTVTVIAVLSLGIGANTAIFSLLDTLTLRPLPVREPGELVELLSDYPGDPRVNAFAWKYYELFREQNQVFSDLTGVSPAEFQVSIDGGEMESTQGGYVAGNFFSMLGMGVELGRMIEAQDDQLGSGAAVTVLSWSYWNERFGRDPGVIGTRIDINRTPTTVIGVAGRGFSGLQVGYPRKLWLPAAMAGQRADGELPLALVARLKSGVGLEQAQAEMRVLDHQRLEDLVANSRTHDPVLRQLRLDLEPAGAGFSMLREKFGKPLLALMSVALLLLSLMCANVSTMLLARAEAREREMAVRVSLGAGRFRLLRQALTESLALSALGAGAGVALAHWGAAALVRIVASGRQFPGTPPIEIGAQLDGRVLLFSIATACIVGLIFGLAPAVRAMRAAPMGSLRAAGSSSEARFSKLFGRSLVATQVALSVVLLSAAGLFITHLSNLRYVGVGFERDNILLVSLAGRGRSEELATLYREALRRLEALPGVHSASFVGAIPTSGAAASDFIRVEGFEERQEDRRYVMFNLVGPRYFETMGTPLIAGREFGLEDWQGRNTAIVNQSMAEHFFAGRDPIGKRITFDRDGRTFEIVGVVGDAKYWELQAPPPQTIYLSSVRQGGTSSRHLVLRTDVAPASLEGPVRRSLGGLLTEYPVVKIRTMASQMDESLVPERLTALLSGLFGGLGAALAAIGLYGLLAYAVARRTNEIGIRMALGATRDIIVTHVLRDALAMVCAGLAVGCAVSFWSNRLASGVFSAIVFDDGSTVLLGAVSILAVAILASCIPARRASRVNPIEALRHD